MQKTAHPGTPDDSADQAGAVFRLIYRSHSKIAEADCDHVLGEILRVARANNAAQGITGALMLYSGWFSQVLEGEEAKIRKLFAVIKADARHGSVQLTEEANVPRRAFARWAMANVGEHGHPDVPLVATSEGTTEGAPWRLSDEQESVVLLLRGLTRGYGIGA